MVPYKTQGCKIDILIWNFLSSILSLGRGWGLKSLAPIKKGQFIIEYVGELIDSEEYQRRIKKMHEKKEENYYFMTVDGDRMIDAGPKGTKNLLWLIWSTKTFLFREYIKVYESQLRS